LVNAAIQATKQRWKACASSVAKILWACRQIGAEPAQEVELLFAKAGDVGKCLSQRKHY
jgi:hypothetical protein